MGFPQRPATARGPTIRSILISGVSAAALAGAALGPSPAQAACNPPAGPGTPAPGTTVTCSGTTDNQNAPNGYGDGSQNGLAINVVTGASVTGTFSGLRLNNSNSVSNAGTIATTNLLGSGIVSAGSITVTNAAGASIQGGLVGRGLSVAGNLVLDNAGQVIGGSGIDVGGNATIVNRAGGSIGGSTSGGIGVGGNLDLDNSGSIGSGNHLVSAIVVGGTANVINRAGGSIGSLRVAGSVTIDNAGSFFGTPSFDTISAGGSVTITNRTGASTGSINAGLDVSVDNSGAIVTDRNLAIAAGRNATIVNRSGASIDGFLSAIHAAGNVTVDNAGTIGGRLVLLSAIFSGGSADITNRAGATIFSGAGAAISTGGSLNLDNAGLITGATTGISAGGSATIFNAGTITANGAAISTGGSLNLDNFGLITAATAGIRAGGSATIFNTGTITANGVAISTGGSLNLDNFGLITGATGISAGGSATIFNAGTIIGRGGTAIQFAAPINTLTLGPGYAIIGNVTGGTGNVLQLGGNGADTFDVSEIGPKYQSFTTFNKIDASTWTLTGANSALLPWNVQQGTLVVAATASLPNSPFLVNGGATLSVDGTIGAVTLGSGGTLMGGGTLGALTVDPGGIVAPGHSIGTLAVTGPLKASGMTYQVEVNAAGQSDRIVTTGTATVAGGTVEVSPQPGSYGRITTYTILHADGGRTGTFDSVTSSVPYLTPSLLYDPFNVVLTLFRDGAFFRNLAVTPNQAAVAGALDTFPSANPLLIRLGALPGASFPAAFDALSGEIHPSVGGVLHDESFFMRNALLARMRQFPSVTENGVGAVGAGSPMLAYAEPDPNLMAADFPVKARPGAKPDLGTVWWTQALGAWGRAESDGNAASLRRQFTGILTGVDTARWNGWRAGLAGGYTQSQVSVADRASSATVDTAQVGAYAGGMLGAFQVRTGAAFALHAVDTRRSIVLPVLAERDTARYNAYVAQVFGEVGYATSIGRLSVEPFAGIAWAGLHTDAFTESGGEAALSAASSTENVGYSSLGLRLATSVGMANGFTLIPRVSASWQHAFGGDIAPRTTFSFVTAGAPFTIAGLPIARDSAVVEGGADVLFRPNFSLGLSYVGQLANAAHDHGVKGKATWTF